MPMVALRPLALAKCDRAWVQGNSTRLGDTLRSAPFPNCLVWSQSLLCSGPGNTWPGWSGTQISFGNWIFRIMGFFPCHPWLSPHTCLLPLPRSCLRVHPGPGCRHQHSYSFHFFLVLIPVPSGPCILQKCSAKPIRIEL